MSEEVQLCVLRVGDEDYVIDIRRVEEIIEVPLITRVPRAPAFLEGVVKLRGEVLPVIDVRRRLGVVHSPERLASPKARRRERLVVCRIGLRRLGLVVDAVTQVMRIAVDQLRPAPLTSHPGEAPHIIGVCGEPNRLRLLLDVKALVGGAAT